MEMLNKSDNTEMIMQATFMLAKQRHLEFVTPELTLASLSTLQEIEHLFHVLNQDLKAFRKELLDYIDTLEKVPEDADVQITPSQQFGVMLGVAVQLANSTGAPELDIYHHTSKASILRRSAFFTVQLSHPYMTTGKTIALTRRPLLTK